MVGDNMSKRNNGNRRQRRKEQPIVEEQQNIELKKVIKILIVMAVTLGVFYLLTMGILSKKDPIITTPNPSIQYNKLLVGESFTQKEKDYLVLYYDSTKDNMDTVHNLISNYNDKKEKLYLYTVDMSEAFNKEYISNESNKSATKAEELKIAGLTLIHFKDNKIVEYVTDNIDSYLK